MSIRGVVSRFRNAPRNAALAAILNLPVDDRLIRLVEQCVLVGRHHEQRHQVLEHRAAPRQQRLLTVRGGEQSPQREPVFLPQLPLSNPDITGEPRFRREQVVEARVALSLADVVANGQQSP